jgi:hypothetical protein
VNSGDEKMEASGDANKMSRRDKASKKERAQVLSAVRCMILYSAS